MNALQKLAEFEGKLAVLEKMVVGVPKIVQDFTRLSDDVKQINQACANLIEVINKRTGELAKVDNIVITRQMALEQSLASLSKTCAAMVAEMVDTKVLDQGNVMTRIRRSEEDADKERISKMIEQKVLKEAESAKADSMLIVAQKFTSNKDNSVDVVSEYRSSDLSSPEIDEETRKNYVGKRAGDVVELNLEDGVLKTTIVQVYDYVQVYADSKGEDAAQDEAQPEANQQ